MITFRSSSPTPNPAQPTAPGATPAAAPASAPAIANGATSATVHDRVIGDILRQANNLSAEQLEKILLYQRERGVKFGEAAVALGFVRSEDVLWALSQQFHYPYASDSRQHHLNDELVLATKPFSQQAESFRAIRSQLMMRLYSGTDDVRRAIAVVSPDSGDGKSFFAANMAVAFSQLGGRTLLVDADMRNPRQHEIFNVDNSSGLSGILSGRVEANVIRPVEELPSLFILPMGTLPPNPLELVERPAFGLLIRELLSKFDYVIVDTPAAVFGSDGSVIAAKCGAALAIARQNRTGLAPLYDLMATLAESPAKIIGSIVNEF